MAGHALARQGRREAGLPVGEELGWALLGSPPRPSCTCSPNTGQRQLHIRAKESGGARVDPHLSLLSLKP